MKHKKHLIDGNYYTVRQLTIKLGINHHRIKAKLLEGASTLEGLKAKVVKESTKMSPNYRYSMYADEHGYWKLLARALKC